MWCRVSLKIVLLKFRWPCFFEIILVNSHIGLTRCAIFTAILSRKQAASILANLSGPFRGRGGSSEPC